MGVLEFWHEASLESDHEHESRGVRLEGAVQGGGGWVGFWAGSDRTSLHLDGEMNWMGI